MKKAYLLLADGKKFQGNLFGHSHEAAGEVVFNTSMTGYQEILTDPSYAGQIVVMTYPQIGNYGTNAEDEESDKIYASAFIIKELSSRVSNFRSDSDLDSYLKKHKICGLEGVDTRALVRYIREKGSMPAKIIFESNFHLTYSKKEVDKLPSMEGQDYVAEVTTPEVYTWKSNQKGAKKVFVYDYGVKRNILRLLSDYGCDLTVFPAQTPAETLLEGKPDGIFLSNGPGDPAAVGYGIENVKKLLGEVPIFGICLGHQILSLALGLKSFKLPFGHHGGNHPVKNFQTGRIEITSQNHGFAIEAQNLPPQIELTHLNLNDNTVEGIRHREYPAFSIQYHPEAAPGPHDSRYLFDDFMKLMEKK